MRGIKMLQLSVITLIIFLLGFTDNAAISTSTIYAAPNAWILYEKPKEGFAIALPSLWAQINMDQKTRDAIIKTNPEWQKEAENEGIGDRVLSESGFYAIDSTETGVTATVNVIKQHLGKEVSLNLFTQHNIADIAKMPSVIKPIMRRRVNLIAGEAEELQYRMDRNFSGQTFNEVVTQYAFVKGKDAYVITFGTSVDHARKYAPIFEKIAKSFRLIK